MSSSRRPTASEDSILASLERSPSAARTHRSWLIIGGSAAAVLTLMIAWLAYGNATSVRALPQSAVKRPAAPPADDGMLSQSLPSISIPAPQTAAIVDEQPSAEASGPPAMVMLPEKELEIAKASAPVTAVPRQVAKANKPPAKRPAVRTTAAKKAKSPAMPPAAGPEVDSDVALLSAILAHATRHAAERAEQESCQGKKCAAKRPSQP